jgi:alpha-tubulin suppressor-like RCC1 family protein
MKKVLLLLMFFCIVLISSCTKIASENPYFMVSVGDYHMVAVSPENRVYTWGQNLYGQLGNGEFGIDQHSSLPIDITELFGFKRNESILDVAAGAHHNLLITTSGRIFLWGTEDIYDNDGERVSIPIEITSRFDLEQNEMIFKVEAYYHNLAITSKGRIFSWGNNLHGQLGIETYGWDDFYEASPIDITSAFGLDQDDYIIDASVSRISNLVLTHKGRVFTWGAQDMHLTHVRSAPVEITNLFELDENEVIKKVSGEADVAISSLNKVYLLSVTQTFSGENGMQYEDSVDLVLTNLFNLSTNEIIVDIDSNRNSSYAISSNSRIFCWGMIRVGQNESDTPEFIFPPIRFLTETPEDTPKEITLMLELDSDEGIAMIINSRLHTVVVTTQHRIFTWGNNQYGTLGDGTTEDNYVPKDISENFK